MWVRFNDGVKATLYSDAPDEPVRIYDDQLYVKLFALFAHVHQNLIIQLVGNDELVLSEQVALLKEFFWGHHMKVPLNIRVHFLQMLKDRFAHLLAQ